jgi:hydroxymethylpyrimidine/phosphomethylpyrimidine kinase
MSSAQPATTPEGPETAQEPAPPASVMSFNASDPSGAGGMAGDIATIAAMGAHALPVVTGIVMRDTAEIFDHHALDADVVARQARSILEDITLSGWKVGFLGSAETVSAVAEVLSDYPDLPLVSYMPSLSWLDEDQLIPYLDAFRELILPATEVLVGSHKTLTDFLLVTGVMLASKGNEQFIDNVLASPQGALTGEKFERFEAAFVGAGDTLAAALASLLAAGSELQAAVGEALAFLDQSLDSGFRPGMGNVVPDRFFWALPPAEDGEDGEEAQADSPADSGGVPRRVH